MNERAESSKDQNSEAQASANGPAQEPGATSEPRANDANLPMVISPKLTVEDAFESVEAETTNDSASEASAAGETAAAPARTSRFAMLAATIALTAALGSFAGSIAGYGLGRLLPGNTSALPANADASGLARAMKAQLAELAALKTSLDGSVRNASTQFTSISERLDRVEHAQADSQTAAKHIADAVDRLTKAGVAPETTGTIAAMTPGAAAVTPAPAPGAPSPSEPKITDRLLEDWVVHDVRNGRALVENRYGEVFFVAEGGILPSLGRVETVKRQDGHWMVVTARGTITSGR